MPTAWGPLHGRPQSSGSGVPAAPAAGSVGRGHQVPGGWEVTVISAVGVTLAEAFLSSPRAAGPNTCRAYAGAIDRPAAELGPNRPLAAVPGDEVTAALCRLWASRAPATWNHNRATVVSWLTWCASWKRRSRSEVPVARVSTRPMARDVVLARRFTVRRWWSAGSFLAASCPGPAKRCVRRRSADPPGRGTGPATWSALRCLC